MIFGSVCSGIEAASAAWHPLGWRAAFVSEIEPFPCAVLAHHYTDVPNFGDMTKFKEWPDAAIDVLVGGTPCQSFSVAGLRKGLADPRGNLMLTYLAIAAKYRPRWLVWENVPGVLSSNGGRDFASLLRGLAELGYGFAYRILDAQYFGVPQRRRRVFVVGHLGDWRRAAAVLFERHSLQGHPAPSREAGKGFTHPVAPSLTSSGRGVERGGDTRGQDPVVALCMSTGQAGAEIGIGIGTTLNCNHEAPIVTHSLRAEGFDAREDGTGRGTPLVPVAFTTEQTPKFNDDCALTLTKQSPTGGGQPQCVAFAQNQRDEVRTVAGALAAEPGMKQQTYIAQDYKTGNFESADVARGLTTSADRTRAAPIVGAMQVRRLLPVECEKLQGFLPGYTDVPYRNKPAADGPRYKALGNSMAVPCMLWIGQRIQMVEDIK